MLIRNKKVILVSNNVLSWHLNGDLILVNMTFLKVTINYRNISSTYTIIKKIYPQISCNKRKKELSFIIITYNYEIIKQSRIMGFTKYN